MIDFHCHILPGVNDGAIDLADSLGMARQAAANGIASVCATPHIRRDHDVLRRRRFQARRSVVVHVQWRVRESDPPDVRSGPRP
jgi:tyrosine-protein phosphatase YwqE